MKKLLTLFLSVMMLATLCFGLAVEAAEIENLIPNADLSQVGADGVPAGFAFARKEGSNNKISVVDVTGDTENVVKGTKAIKVEKTEAEDLYLHFLNADNMDIVIPGETYTFSYMLKSTGVSHMLLNFSNSRTTFNFETLSDGTKCDNQYWTAAATKWTKIEQTFTMPESRKFLFATARFATNNLGTFEIADISLIGKKRINVNVAPNYGFTELDENDLPAGWTAEATVASGSYDISVKPEGPNGEKAVVFTGTVGVQMLLYYDLNNRNHMVPGEQYVVSFDYNIDGGNHYARLISGDTAPTIGSTEKDADGVLLSQDVNFASNSGGWKSAVYVVTASRHTAHHWLYFYSSNRGAKSIKIANVKVEGIRRPNSEPAVGSEMITNGGFASGSEGWTLSAESVLKTEESNTYAALPNLGNYAEIKFPVGDSKVYEVQADVKSSVSGSLKVSVRTAPSTSKNQEKGAPFFERVLDYSYTFVDSGSAWKKVKFNVYPSDEVSDEITIRFENAIEDAVLAFDNFSVKPTKELISNGDFEGLAFISKTAADSQDGKAVTDGIPGWSVAYNNGVGSVSFGASDGQSGAGAKVAIASACNGDNEPYLTQKIRMESGKTYKVTYSINATHTNCPQAGWNTNSYGGVSDLNSFNWHALTANTWTTVTKYITMPSVHTDGKEWTTKDTAWTFRWAGRSQTGSYYVDNVSIQEVPNGVNYYNANGEKYTSLGDAKGKTIYSYFASATLPQDTEISLISALYDVSSGIPMLVDATVTKGKNSMNAPIWGTIDIPDYEGKYKLSVFCLDSITGLKALEAKYDFE